MSYFNLPGTGIVISLGALCVSVTDSPGPVQHRLNGMLYCIVIITLAAIIVSYAAVSPLLLGVLLFVSGFLFSMLTVYGARISSIGIAALLIIILSLQTPIQGQAIWLHALYILIGGTWYMLFSLLLYKIRPYKIIQQILGDYIIDIGEYLKTRGLLYEDHPEYKKTYMLLLQQQVKVQAQQSLVSDLLFKTRTIVKESTNKGRVLLKIYVDAAGLFESIMTSFQDYKILHSHFDDTGILKELGPHINLLADEMNEIGVAVKSGLTSKPRSISVENAKRIQAHFQLLRVNYMNNKNLDNFISLGRIVGNVQHLTEKINGLHYYTTYDKKIKKPSGSAVDYSNYAEIPEISAELFWSNFNFKSNIFRHSVRVAFALLLGYIISVVFNIGHSYWILLTIVVILKPAYSLTKKRNTDRLIGTFLGITIGVVLLYFIKDSTALLVIMILFMATSYSFMRTSYFINVLTMTPYLVIFFHLLYPSALKILLTDRIIDTLIGSVIAFIASIFFVPAWEHTTIKSYMKKMLEADKNYYALLSACYGGNNSLRGKDFKLQRRNLLTALANVSDAFNRMLSEPKRFQKGIEAIHRFVVLNHILTSHFAALSYYLNVKENSFRSADLLGVTEDTQQFFSNAIQCLQSKKGVQQWPGTAALYKLNEQATILLEKRRQEITLGNLETPTKEILVEVKSVIDQFNYIYNIASDIAKSCTENIG